jgi:hypothetical protein
MMRADAGLHAVQSCGPTECNIEKGIAKIGPLGLGILRTRGPERRRSSPLSTEIASHDRAAARPTVTRRRQPATITPHQGIQGLTAPAAECKKLSASEAPDPERHHVGTPGGIISECPGDFIGIRSFPSGSAIGGAFCTASPKFRRRQAVPALTTNQALPETGYSGPCDGREDLAWLRAHPLTGRPEYERNPSDRGPLSHCCGDKRGAQ